MDILIFLILICGFVGFLIYVQLSSPVLKTLKRKYHFKTPKRIEGLSCNIHYRSVLKDKAYLLFNGADVLIKDAYLYISPRYPIFSCDLRIPISNVMIGNQCDVGFHEKMLDVYYEVIVDNDECLILPLRAVKFIEANEFQSKKIVTKNR